MKEGNYPRAYLYMRVVQAKLFMERNYPERIDLDLITGEAFFSKWHFIRTFSRIYGMTPYRFLKKIRIQKAKEMFNKGSSIREVCQSVGFESVSTSAGLFKREVGQTPAEYRSACKLRRMRTSCTPLRSVPACFAERLGWV